MRINLQKFTLSTLTFSLATTLAVGGFSESASARRGAQYDDSSNLPVLEFNAFYEKEGSTDQIPDKFPDDTSIGVFENAITILNRDFELDDKNNVENILGETEVEGFFIGNNPIEPTKANLSASLDEATDEITYQIYLGDAKNYENPKDFLKFTPVKVSPDSQDAFVNNIKSILDDSIPNTYGIFEGQEGDFSKSGVLGVAVNSSLGSSPFQVRQLGSPPSTSTSIPEPTTTLASVFALGFAGKFLRKSKKSNA